MRKYLPFVLIFLMILIILGSSTVDGPTSYGSSKSISAFVVRVLRFFGDTNYSMNTIDMIIRKMAHFVEYLILTVLLIVGFSNLLQGKWSSFLIGAVIAFCISIVDEALIQGISDRQSSLFDIMVDSSGIFIGMVVHTLSMWLNMHSKQ